VITAGITRIRPGPHTGDGGWKIMLAFQWVRGELGERLAGSPGVYLIPYAEALLCFRRPRPEASLGETVQASLYMTTRTLTIA